MMRTIILVLVCGLMLPVACSWATPVKTATEATQEANPTGEGNYNLDWSYVYNYKGSSGVAVDNYWLLTAHHVADDPGTGNLTIGIETYTAVETIYNIEADLGLVRYDKAFPGYYDYTTDTSFIDSEVVMIGYGRNGVVTQGLFGGSWTEGGEESPDIIRWGTNTVDGLVLIEDAFIDTYLMLKTTISGTHTNEDPTPYETGVNTGDSGGGMFAEEGGEWTLIGINAYRGPGSSPYDTTYSVPVGDYDEWIANTILESMLLGDANGDHIVDLQDFGILKANFGLAGGWAEGNFNGDTVVDLQDFSILKDHFGEHFPEPATLGLLLLGGMVMLIRRRVR